LNENEREVIYIEHETAMLYAPKAMDKYREALARLAK
jgi:hypothetical protein